MVRLTLDSAPPKVNQVFFLNITYIHSYNYGTLIIIKYIFMVTIMEFNNNKTCIHGDNYGTLIIIKHIFMVTIMEH